MDTPLGADSDFLEPTLKYTIAVWWAWFWRMFLLAFAGGGCFGALFGIIRIAVALSHPSPIAPHRYPNPIQYQYPMQYPARYPAHASILGILLLFLAVSVAIQLVAQVWALHLVLKKNFKRFSVRLVKNQSEQLRLELGERKELTF